ncbi:MAG: hypothetical protein JRI97_11370 [Deltaproteobacteria bacterium]|nr:hypothetical protein [Deltaproteobacteria bacterium]
MYLLVCVINNEEILDEIITTWLDLGITGGTVIDSTDILEYVSNHVPIFAGFRSLTTGGTSHNKTLFTTITEEDLLDQAVNVLKAAYEQTGKPHQGVYFVVPLKDFDYLGKEVGAEDRKAHAKGKLGK